MDTARRRRCRACHRSGGVDGCPIRRFLTSPVAKPSARRRPPPWRSHRRGPRAGAHRISNAESYAPPIRRQHLLERELRLYALAVRFRPDVAPALCPRPGERWPGPGGRRRRARLPRRRSPPARSVGSATRRRRRSRRRGAVTPSPPAGRRASARCRRRGRRRPWRGSGRACAPGGRRGGRGRRSRGLRCAARARGARVRLRGRASGSSGCRWRAARPPAAPGSSRAASAPRSPGGRRRRGCRATRAAPDDRPPARSPRARCRSGSRGRVPGARRQVPVATSASVCEGTMTLETPRSKSCRARTRRRLKPADSSGPKPSSWWRTARTPATRLAATASIGAPVVGEQEVRTLRAQERGQGAQALERASGPRALEEAHVELRGPGACARPGSRPWRKWRARTLPPSRSRAARSGPGGRPGRRSRRGAAGAASRRGRSQEALEDRLSVVTGPPAERAARGLARELGVHLTALEVARAREGGPSVPRGASRSTCRSPSPGRARASAGGSGSRGRSARGRRPRPRAPPAGSARRR